MLEELRIRGLGVIEDAVLPLGPGLTVVTGETGAGKTMVVTGLMLLFGGRADAARVRSGSEQATVDGRLDVSDAAALERVRSAGGQVDDESSLVLRRTVSAAGRSRAYVGGAAAPVAVLGELAERLLAVHGQADQLRLTRPAQQRQALDRYAGIDLGAYATAYARWRRADAELAERTSRAASLRREAELLQHGIAEIAAAAPEPGEDGELTALAQRLAHADALRLAAAAAHDALLGGVESGGLDTADVVSLLGTARRVLAQQADADAELDALGVRLGELASLAADLGTEFGSYAEGLDADPARLAQVEGRRAVLAALVRKYADGPQPDVSGVLAWAEQAKARLVDVDVSDEAIAELTRRRDEAGAELVRLAEDISARRRTAAHELGAAVTAELAGLAMPQAALRVDVRARASGEALGGLTLGADGADDVEFLLAAHPDAPALALSRGASGGELSRVMLALEVCLAATDPVPTMIFDEVDAGVGGRAAVEVGRRLSRLARDVQVIVVTHLAQVAAYADRHIVVDKNVDKNADKNADRNAVATTQADPDTDRQAGSGVTASDVRLVHDSDRVGELARMLAGSSSQTALDHAAELLAGAAADRPAQAQRAATRKGAKTRS